MPRSLFSYALSVLVLLVSALVMADPYPPTWNAGNGAAIHYAPVAWPNEPANPLNCGDTCQDWKPYTRFDHSANDPRTRDPSNGGTAPQGYVNVSSSCGDKTKPSIYYYLHQGATEADDVLMFRWRVEAAPQNYATGPSAGTYGASNPWSAALWTVLFDLDGSGYRSLAAHLDGSSGSPSAAVDRLVGIWGNTPSQSLDYVTNPDVHILAHNPTAFIGPGGKILNFGNALTPTENWPNGASETVWDYGTTRARLVSSNSCSEYFVDYQIPIAMLDASGSGGPKITRSTPIAMLFCTANSLNNPFQKDCAINSAWVADASKPAPFGDYISFNQSEPYVQPIVSKVTALPPSSCPGNYSLQATVQDALAVENGVVVPSVQAVDFYYWYDADGNGLADDAGSSWTQITPSATLDSGTLNKWSASWDTSALPKGKYLVGVQAVDDNTKLDNDMTPSGIDNRTFSYISGDAANKVYINGSGWMTGQQTAFPSHVPSQAPSSSEDWYGNPDVTGQQVAVVGTAINACGVAPSISYSANVSSVVAGGTIQYTVTVTNPSSNSSAVTVSNVSALLPAGFSYQSSSSVGSGGFSSANPTISGQTLTWTFGAPVSLAAGNSATMTFDVSAGSTSGNYNSSAGASTSFSALSSAQVAVAVDAARLSLRATPSAYSIAADGSSLLTLTYAYSNDSTVTVSAAQISSTLPAGVTYVSCGGGCTNTSGTLSWSLGNLAGGASGSVTVVFSVPSTYSTSSLAETATLTATAPDNSTVTQSATATVAVTGYTVPGGAAFSLTKTANNTQIAPNGTVVYTISYSNYGTASASGVTITDTLPAGLTYASSTGGGSNSSGTVTWSIGTVAASGSGSVTVTATAASPFTATNPTSNTASLNWTGGSTVTSDPSSVGITGQSCSTYYFSNSTANVGAAGTQKIAKSLPVPVSGDTGNTVSVTAPVSGASFLEAVRFYQDPPTSNDVPFNGDITSNIYIDRANGQGLNIRTTVYDYNSTTGTTTQLGQGTSLFTGSTKGLLSFTVTPSGTLSKNHRLLWVYDVRSNHASQTVPVQIQWGGTVTNGISGGTTFANSYASYCVTPPANLSGAVQVSQSGITAATTPTLTYTIPYANNGSASATNAVLTNSLPTGFTGCEYSTNNSTWSTCSGVGSSPQTHTFSLGTITAGATGTVYVRGTVPSGTTGGETYTDSISLVSDQTSAVTDTVTTTVAGGIVGGTPSLVLGLSAAPTLVQPGASVTYSVTVTNIGDASATNVVVSNALPVTSYYSYNSDCSGSCSNSSNTLSWTVGTLAAGASQTYTYSMLVGSSGLSAGVTTVSDTASATGDSGLTATSNATVVSINANPSLSASMSANPNTGLAPSSTLTYTMTVQNTGNVSAANVVVTDPVPIHTSFRGSITASVGTGSFDAINNRMVYTVGTLAAGATATLTYQVTVGALDSGSTTLTNTATASASNAAQQTFSATASASASATLTLSHNTTGTSAYPAASLTADASGTTLLVDHAERFVVGQYIKVGSSVAQVTAVGAHSLLLDTSITASTGANVIGAVTLALNYANTGNATANNTVLSDILPTGLNYYTAVPTPDTAPSVGSTGNVSWTLGSLASGGSGSRAIYVFPSGITGILTAQGSVTANNASTVNVDADVTIGGLSVSKTTTTAVLSAGGIAHYEITISNSLSSPVTNVDVTDTLPAGFSYRANTAMIGAVQTEPTFALADTSLQEPTWSALTIPGSGTVVIAFDADVASSLGAGSYDNEVAVTGPVGVGIQQFDALQSSDENTSVLAANQGVLKGYVFKRTNGSGASYDPVADIPLNAVRVEIYKTGADCTDPYDVLCVVVYTNSSGYFEKTLSDDAWYVKVIAGTGDLNAGWTQVQGNNDTLVTVIDQDEVWDHNGFSVPSTYTVSFDLDGGTLTGGGALSQSVTHGGSATAPTLTPPTGKVFSAWSAAFNNVTSNLSITALYVDATYTVSFDLDGGTLTGGGGLSQSVTHGGSATAPTLTPPTGKVFSAWSAAFNNVTSNLSIIALYVDATYTVSFDLDGGTRTGGGGLSQSVTHGSSATAPTLTPPTGKVFSAWSAAFNNVTSNLSVTAIYANNSNTVTPSVSGSGSINPSVSTTVTYNGTLAFTLTPNASYVVAAVEGSCGGSLSGNVFTTAAVTTNCTVIARFEPLLNVADQYGNAMASQQVVPRNAPNTFSVNGGKGVIGMTAAVKQAGISESWNVGTVEEFLSGRGGSLSENVDGSYTFTASRSGRYSFTFEDEDGQQSTLSFLVHPEVAFTTTHQYGSQGVEIKVSVALDDDPIDYPATVPYTVEGSTLSPQLSASGSYQITSGRKASLTFTPSVSSGEIKFNLVQNGLLNAVLGSLTEHRVSLVAAEVVPLFVTLQAEQDGTLGTVELSSGGLVSISSSLTGANYLYDWSASDEKLGLSGNGSTVTFDPSSKAGLYRVTLRVTEVGGAGRTAVAEIYIQVVNALPNTYSDFINVPPKAGSARLAICPDGGMQRVDQCLGVTDGIYLETLETFQIALGVSSSVSSWNTQEFGLAIEDRDVLNEQGEDVRDWRDVEYTHLSYRVDFDISGLESPGQSVPAVVPLRPGVVITANNVWRKYKYKDGQGWVNFVENDRNTLASAHRNTAGDCPWAGSSTGWTAGLNSGDDCVRLIIEDGGPNDLDGRADGVIRDPGALAVKATNVEVHTVGKGGGAIDRLFLLMTTLLLLQRRTHRRSSTLQRGH